MNKEGIPASQEVNASLPDTMMERLGKDCFDIGYRELIVSERKVYIFYVTGLIDSVLLQVVITELLSLNSLPAIADNLFGEIGNRLVHQQVTIEKDMEKAALQVLSGLVAIGIEGTADIYVLDLRSYPGRGPAEPDTEKTVRGSRDGFTENIVINTALIRRRIRTNMLKNEIFQIGRDSHTDIAMMYLEGVADPRIIENVRNRIKGVETDSLTMSDKELEEFMTHQVYNPYPLVRYTERPDVAAAQLYQGQVAVIVDTSPSVMLAPVTFFDHLTAAEEHRQTPAVGTFLRFIRFSGIIMSVFLMPTWLLVVLHPELLPAGLSFIGPQQEGNLSIILQVIVGELGIEFIRMAAIHTPSAIGSALGIVSAIMIGGVAVDIGLFGPEVLFYVAVGTLGGFVTPSYELGLANKMFKMFIIIGVILLGVWGYIGAAVLGFIYLATIKSFGQPYLYPLIPFNGRELFQSIFRVSSRYQYRARIEQRKNKH